ncbi:RNA polymerase sigma factor [Ruficoccus amylovorans]|uniref:RNA polymerase sigma factor n=1 Tax=Ruficoccus amylovorans TaxID=1804625 RepID=A0A842HEG6_9BACT|nr:RNA polymerase sigma factor [Ruficoccus amylovorans]MBC2594046.1 RNA polymerase sigma factor [Ruficoccus amylovorans]
MSDHANLNFSDLVETYYTPLYRFAYSLAKNEHEASDLTQQTFVIYAEKGDSLRDSSKVKSWLFTTLYREFLRLRRRAAHVTPQENDILELEAPSVEPGIARTLDSQSALDALEQVDEAYRAPLTLFYLKSLSYKEIAETLDIPIGTVMSRLSRGKAQLKNILLSSTAS